MVEVGGERVGLSPFSTRGEHHLTGAELVTLMYVHVFGAASDSFLVNPQKPLLFQVIAFSAYLSETVQI